MCACVCAYNNSLIRVAVHYVVVAVHLVHNILYNIIERDKRTAQRTPSMWCEKTKTKSERDKVNRKGQLKRRNSSSQSDIGARKKQTNRRHVMMWYFANRIRLNDTNKHIVASQVGYYSFIHFQTVEMKKNERKRNVASHGDHTSPRTNETVRRGLSLTCTCLIASSDRRTWDDTAIVCVWSLVLSGVTPFTHTQTAKNSHEITNAKTECTEHGVYCVTYQ